LKIENLYSIYVVDEQMSENEEIKNFEETQRVFINEVMRMKCITCSCLTEYDDVVRMSELIQELCTVASNFKHQLSVRKDELRPIYDNCFTCNKIMRDSDDEMNGDWCSECRKQNKWRCYYCDIIQNKRKYCEDLDGNAICKDCRRTEGRDAYTFRPPNMNL